MKVPVPEASVVNELLIVGFGEVDQQTPLAVTFELPCEVTIPPEIADVFEIFDIGEVDTIGRFAVGAVGVTTHVVPFHTSISPFVVPLGNPFPE